MALSDKYTIDEIVNISEMLTDRDTIEGADRYIRGLNVPEQYRADLSDSDAWNRRYLEIALTMHVETAEELVRLVKEVFTERTVETVFRITHGDSPNNETCTDCDGVSFALTMWYMEKMQSDKARRE